MSAGKVWFSLSGTTYQNNSIVTLVDIGENDNAVLCMTNLTACCQHEVLGKWSFPNGTTVPSEFVSASSKWDFFRDRGQMMVPLHRRRGGMDGIYSCEIPDSMSVTQTIYIGVYSASTGK